MSAPIQYEVEEQSKLEIEEMSDGRWKVKKINISIYKDPEAVLVAINDYIKQRELEEKASERTQL